MAAITLTSKELLIHTVDLAVDHFLATLGPKRRILLSIRMLHLLFVLI